MTWIKQAWESVIPEVIRKSFKKCGISNALDGSEDGIFNDNDDTESEFDGFTADDVEMCDAVLENLANVNISESIELGNTQSDSELTSSETESTDYDSPGH